MCVYIRYSTNPDVFCVRNSVTTHFAVYTH